MLNGAARCYWVFLQAHLLDLRDHLIKGEFLMPQKSCRSTRVKLQPEALLINYAL